ncbi:hypothetical protein CRE_27028 [Caenorhabditis remanei]|uniref:G-protein coupled receptors family 1 profile domain-containing protein n=1 Tax=Caenorhabditis remanei TaxID=31234 RepID=E3LPU7_CAERE|nr:hypothetical protein CRE_27028 [Caenorhabditis remanei]
MLTVLLADMDKCPFVFFKEYEASTATNLCKFRNFVMNIMAFAPYISLVCLLINLFHVIVLTQKSMRNSSINLILAAVAISDICFLLFPIQLEVVAIQDSFQPCSTMNSYPVLLIKSIFDSIQFTSRRFSIWLSLSIAVIRTLVVRNPLDPKISQLSKPKSLGYCILCILPICLPVSILGWLKYNLVLNPVQGFCAETNSPMIQYSSNYSDLFIANDYFVFRLYNFLESIISKLIPCILFPIFTFLLVKELLKAEKSRAKMLNSGHSENSSGRKTKLVLYLTITFFIADFPLGIVIFLKLFFYPSSAITEVLNIFTFLFSFCLTVNTSTHMFICFYMSSQYRQTAKLILCCSCAPKRLMIPETECSHKCGTDNK